ncbi:3-coathanger stack domain-containing protein [Emticicia sp. C21]|uniref:3-coathanger stack domain-containing protein n=1 Tax=Emticicia sp. C21 TaxID=2302915 RepID=UPI000E350EA2|nr:3-coathanger stack domain-containing protein [Emticicia sp. C21]RFS17027.1 hypothetical protein D0T08_10135 [Emticicia sp. C21]
MFTAAAIKIKSRATCLSFILLLATYALSAQELVHDIAPSTKSIVIENTCMVDSTFYFSTKNLETGVKSLWRTDGQTNGTIELINSSQSNAPVNFQKMTAWKGKLFFTSGDEYHKALWVSDGTAIGTKKIQADIGSTTEQDEYKIFFQGKNYLFFISNRDPANYNGIDLWRTDGTAQGTVFLKSLYTNSLINEAYIDINGQFYFIAFHDDLAIRTEQLWKTDGNTLTFLANLTAKPATFSTQRLLKLGNQLILERFHVNENGFTNLLELWKSNGTPGGTAKYTEYNASFAPTYNFKEYIEMNGAIYYTGADHSKAELWKTDGTASGTRMVSEFAGAGSSSRPEGFVVIDNQLLGTAYIANQTRIFTLTGGIGSAYDINLPDYTYYHTSPNYAKLNNQLYFSAYDDIWRTNGITTSKFFTNTSAFGVFQYLAVNNRLLYIGRNEAYVQKLFVCDGTTATELTPQDKPGFIFRKLLGQTSRLVYFLAYDDIHGHEIWRSDGTVAGTFMLKDIRTEKASSSPGNLIALDDKVYFLARNEKTGTELWKVDTKTLAASLHKEFTTDTTQNFNGMAAYNNKGLILTESRYLWQIKSFGVSIDRQNVRTGSYPANFTPSTNRIFFTMEDGQGIELWSSYMGTVSSKVKTISTDVGGSKPILLTDVNGTVFFAAHTYNTGYELWKSNGESNGTVKVKEITAGRTGTVFNYLYNANGTLLFITDNGKKLWKSDGTDAGTIMLKNFGSGLIYNAFAYRQGFTYFVANDPGNGEGLWRTDGSTLELVRPITLNLSSATDFEIVVFKNLLFFKADTQLWKSDGTNAGTQVHLSIPCSNLVSSEEDLFFKGCDANGCELWKSDNVNTYRVKDIHVGAGSSNPRNFLLTNGKLFFAANDGVHGEELWVYKVCSIEKNITDNYLNGVIKKLEVSDKITATSIIMEGASIKHDAGKAIILNPGFQVQNGGIYQAYINGCADDNN